MEQKNQDAWKHLSSHLLDACKHPKLIALIKANRLWVEQAEYVGMDEDGELVAVGTVGFEDAAESYLQSSGWFNR